MNQLDQRLRPQQIWTIHYRLLEFQCKASVFGVIRKYLHVNKNSLVSQDYRIHLCQKFLKHFSTKIFQKSIANKMKIHKFLMTRILLMNYKVKNTTINVNYYTLFLTNNNFKRKKINATCLKCVITLVRHHFYAHTWTIWQSYCAIIRI